MEQLINCHFLMALNNRLIRKQIFPLLHEFEYIHQ